MVCMERRLGGKEGGRRRSKQREAAVAAGTAEVARSACTNRTMEMPPQKGRDPLFARDGARRDALGLTHSSPASRARTPAAMQRQAARQRGSSMGGGWAGRWVGGKERRNRRKAGECGTRRVGPYAAAPNTDNAGRRKMWCLRNAREGRRQGMCPWRAPCVPTKADQAHPCE